MYDGTLKFDTAIDESGFNIGIDSLGSIAKSGMNLISSAASAALDVISAVADKAVSFGKDVISTGKEFEQGMSQVAATLQYSVTDLADSETEAYKNMEILTAKAEEMGATTAFTATQAAKGLNILAMSGYDAGESVSMIADVLNLASAGSLSLDSAAGYLAVTMKGFQNEAQNSAYYADMIAKGATLAATNVDELGIALSQSAANAASYGQSSTETAVALLRLANQGVTAENAVTSLKTVMSNIYAPSTQAAEIFEKIGFSAYDANGKAKDLNTVIDDLGQAMHDYAGTDDSLFSSMVNDIFGQRGQAAFNKLLASSEEDVQKFYNGLADAEGSAALQAETMLNNLEGKITIFKSALDGLKVKLYQSVQEPLKALVQIGTDALTDLTKAFNTSGIDGLSTVFANELADAASVITGYIPDIAEAGSRFSNRFSESLVRNMPSLTENALQIGLILVEGIANSVLNVGEVAVSLISSLSDGIQSHADDIRQTAADILYRFSEFISENIPVLLEAGIQILSTLCESILTEENIDLLLNVAGVILSSLVTALIEYLPVLIGAAAQLIVFLCDSLITPENIELLINSAFLILSALITALLDNLPALLSAAIQLIIYLCESLLSQENIELLINSALLILGALVTALIDNLPLLVRAAVQIIGAICNALLSPENLIPLLDAAVDLLLALVNAIVDNTDELLLGVEEIIRTICDELITDENIKKIGEIGEELLEGLIVGLGEFGGKLIGFAADMLYELAEAFDLLNFGADIGSALLDGIISGLIGVDFDSESFLADFADNFVTGINAVFEIHSPSKLMRDEVGKYLALGIGEGFVQYMPDVGADAEKALENLNQQMPELVIGNQFEDIIIPDFHSEIQNLELIFDAPVIPEIESPELVFDAPVIPEIESPETGLNVPDLTLPEIPDLRLEIPDFTLPELTAPEFKIPEIPSPERKNNADVLPDRMTVFIDEKALAVLQNAKFSIMQNIAQPDPTSEVINNHYSYSTVNTQNQQNFQQNQPYGDIIIPVSIGGQQLETMVISAIQIENARSGGRTV